MLVSAPALVVDDFRTMRTTMSNLVRDAGHAKIDQVSDSASALDRLQKIQLGSFATPATSRRERRAPPRSVVKSRRLRDRAMRGNT
jgi:CheY-like chemotaxis protein